MDTIIKPKVFISYSWSGQEYEERIRKIVDMLREHGIDTVYDKYDLTHGASIYTFMEQSVNDPTITKVLIFCDKQYKEKANAKKGGAGTETLIISPNVYEDANSVGKDKKFIPIVMEKDETGKACLPTYLNGLLFIDFSRSQSENSEEFIKLVRLLYGKPEFVAPALGNMPSYLDETKPHYMITGLKKDCAINALKNGLSGALNLCEDFFNQVYDFLDKLIIEYDPNQTKVVDCVWNSIEELLPLRNDCLDVVETMIVCNKTEETIRSIHTFFEKILGYKNKVNTKNRFWNFQADHFKFFGYEIFMNFTTFLVDKRYFEQLKIFLDDYYCKFDIETPKLSNFTIFDSDMYSFDIKNRTLNPQRISLKADLLKKRWRGRTEEFEKLMQTDLLLYLCALNMQTLDKTDMYTRWYPVSLVYANPGEYAFELFLRATSRNFFNQTLGKLGLTLDGLKNMKQDLDRLRGHYNGLGWIDPQALINLDKLATKD